MHCMISNYTDMCMQFVNNYIHLAISKQLHTTAQFVNSSPTTNYAIYTTTYCVTIYRSHLVSQ